MSITHSLKHFILCLFVLFLSTACFEQTTEVSENLAENADNLEQINQTDQVAQLIPIVHYNLPFNSRMRIPSNVERAIEMEDHTFATKNEFIDFSLNLIADYRRTSISSIDFLYKDIGDSITWNPSHDSVFFTDSLPSINFPVLKSNINSAGREVDANLIIAGNQFEHYYMAMAANLFAVSVNDQTALLGQKILEWFAQKKNIQDRPIKILTTGMPSRADSRYFPHNENMRWWLNTHYQDKFEINEANECDDEKLMSCIETMKPDLVIISDMDRSGKGFDSITAAFNKIVKDKIPLIAYSFRRAPSNRLIPIYKYMKVQAHGNYWSKLRADNSQISKLKQMLEPVEALLTRFKEENFDTSIMTTCSSNYMSCGSAEFSEMFKNGANWYYNFSNMLDWDGRDVFSLSGYTLLKVGLLLADKFRADIDYPIAPDEPTKWFEALFGDWVISYARDKNIAQPDLGEYIAPRGKVVKGDKLHYEYPDTHTEEKIIDVKYSGQWTSTGWYALPGKPVIIERLDKFKNTRVRIKLHFARPNTNRAYSTKRLTKPQGLTTARLDLPARKRMTFSTPYGAPIYIIASGPVQEELKIRLKAKGVAFHPALLDVSNPNDISRFENLLETTQLPHVDIKASSTEHHLRKDKFMSGIGGIYPSITDLINGVIRDHVNAIYGLAGLKLDGFSLEESLPNSVKAVCEQLFGADDCYDEKLHTRALIQHANYDEYAHCGVGCSGNPWDGAGHMSPTGWLANHELGHNLQVGRLNVHYAPAENKNSWTAYGNRAGENSNNLFAYYVRWLSHYITQGNTNIISDGHMNNKDLFFAFMSDALNLTDSSGKRVVVGSNCAKWAGTDRYTAPWSSNAYAAFNGYRMTFYIQAALHADSIEMATRDRLENGFNIFTLLYQYQRIFGKYSQNEELWNENRDRLGFSLFPFSGHSVYSGRKVNGIPGNDFMLVALSKITGKDWRNFFDMLGLNYTSLAEDQVEINARNGSIPMGMYVLGTNLPPANMTKDLQFLPLSLNDKSTLWPIDKSSPISCKL